MTNSDKDTIKQTMNQPGWKLFEKAMQEMASTYKFQATMPEVEEHYRLILFAKAQGIDEVFTLIGEMIK